MTGGTPLLIDGGELTESDSDAGERSLDLIAPRPGRFEVPPMLRQEPLVASMNSPEKEIQQPWIPVNSLPL